MIHFEPEVMCLGLFFFFKDLVEAHGRAHASRLSPLIPSPLSFSFHWVSAWASNALNTGVVKVSMCAFTEIVVNYFDLMFPTAADIVHSASAVNSSIFHLISWAVYHAACCSVLLSYQYISYTQSFTWRILLHIPFTDAEM